MVIFGTCSANLQVEMVIEKNMLSCQLLNSHMKYLASIVFTFALLSQGLSQRVDFQLADPQPAIHEVYGGTLLSADLDNDGDIDLIQSGLGLNLSGTNAKVTVFLNDGLGDFTIKAQPFTDYFTTEIMVLGDLDDDGDLDLIISAINRTDVYLNDGEALFSIDDRTNLTAADSGEILIGDIDNDGDQDVLQFGGIGSSLSFFSLYLNDELGALRNSFTSAFAPLRLAKAAFIDVENDGDLDVLSFGINPDEELVASLCTNDGLGNYSCNDSTGITPLQADGLSVGDLDSDGDDDFLICGSDASNTATTAVYINDGFGQFTELEDLPFPDMFAGTSALGDLDQDDDLDVLLVGSLEGGLPTIYSLVFENLGDNMFVISDSLKGEYIAEASIADFNGDTKNDIMIQGFIDDMNVYWNQTTLSSIEEEINSAMSVFPNPSSGTVAFTENIQEVKVYGIDGSLQLQYDDLNDTTVDLQHIPVGTYLLVAKTAANEWKTAKIILQR